MYIILQKAVDIVRDEQTQMPISWRGTGENVQEFRDGDAYIEYVKANAKTLGKDTVAFTGSASLLQQANFILVEELKKLGIL